MHSSPLSPYFNGHHMKLYIVIGCMASALELRRKHAIERYASPIAEQKEVRIKKNH